MKNSEFSPFKFYVNSRDKRNAYQRNWYQARKEKEEKIKKSFFYKLAVFFNR